jgi:hypothetical protein
VSLASATKNNRPTLINRVEVEDVLGAINTDIGNSHGSAPYQRLPSYLRDKVGGVHPIAYGRTYRLFSVIEDYNRESLIIDAHFSLPAERVIRSLEQLIEWRSKLQAIRCDVARPGWVAAAAMQFMSVFCFQSVR